jgi:hypothetical protein
MAQAAPSYDRSYQTEMRLHALGLTSYALRQAVSRGIVERRSCNPLLPPVYRGITQWAFTHLGLRELLIPEGWKPDNSSNFCTVVRENGMAIAVATGDDRTGLPGLPQPKTKFPKGPIALDAVGNNQLSLLDDDIVEPSPRAPLETWYLLIANCSDGVRFELSFPQGMDEKQRIDSWRERLIPKSLTFDIDMAPPEEPDDIDIAIEPI